MKLEQLEGLAKAIGTALRPHIRRLTSIERTVQTLQTKGADNFLAEKLARLEARVAELESERAASAWGE